MKVLHLFSNYKFTGPADPALQTAEGLSAAGVQVTFAAGADPLPGSASGVRNLARTRGLDSRDTLQLHKHARPLALLGDVRALRRMLESERFDLVHTHLAADHLTAVLAARARVPIVRTIYDATPPRGLRASYALRRTQGVICFAGSVEHAFRARYPESTARVCTMSPAIDLERFSIARDEAVRRRWGASEESIVIGVVARMQTHRLFPELIEGFARAARTDTRLQLVVLGRGTNEQRVAHEPASRSGVGERIRFPGYIPPAEYPRALPAFDALVFLVPGSDGTCRAAREALVCGVPVIASRRGLLPEFVHDGENGMLLADETPEAIGASIATIATDAALRARMANNAAARARAEFDPARQTAAILELYRALIDGDA